MLKTLNHHQNTVVDLTEGILVQTTIPRKSHPALRAGFAGYPANPRWNIIKFSAWKTGRKWKEALAKGKMIVRSTDSMLVLATDQEDKLEEELPSSLSFNFPIWAKQVIASYQTG